MNKTASDVLIGDLLRSAGLVSLTDLTNAVQVASKTGLPVGRVLVMLGLVTAETVQAALHAQSMIRDQIISLETGTKALCVCSAARITFDEAMQQLGLLRTEAPTNRLGELLIVTELITEEQLADALAASQHLGLPLGRILVLKGIMSEMQVESALEAQVLLRDGRISRLQALEALRTMRMCGTNIRESLAKLGCEKALQPTNTIRLGELVVMADVVSESDLLTALEIGLMENMLLGQVLIEFGFIDDDALDAALRLQTMVSNSHLSVDTAVHAMRLICFEKYSLVQAVAEVMEPEVLREEIVSLLDLLQLAGLITSDEYGRLLRFKDTSIFQVVLVGTGLMSETTLHVAICCHVLLKEGLLTCEQAIVALHHWRWTGINLTDILQTLGWSAGAQPPIVPGIYKWEPAPDPDGAPKLSPVEALLTSSLTNAEISVTSSLANYEWGVPQIHHSWH